MTAQAAAFREPRLWASVWRLLRMRLVILISGFRRANKRKKAGYIFAAVGLLIFLGFILFLSIMLLQFLRSPALLEYVSDMTPFLEAFPTMMVSVSTLGILMTGFGVLLQALYLSGDMDFLMSAPIPVRAVFIAKLVQAVLPNFGLMCLFTLPILFGLGISGGYNLLYYPMVLVVLVLLSLAAASLASLLVMTAARFFPARRMAEVLGFVVGTFIFIFSQSARFMRFDVNNQQVTSMLQLTERFNQPWSPLTWAGKGLVDLGKGDFLPAAGLLAAALVVTGAVFYAALSTSERLYYTGWSSLQNNRRKPKARAIPAAVTTAQGEAVSSRPVNPLARLIPAPIRAILVKDLIMYRRDLRNVSQLLTPLILGVVYAIGLLQTGGKGLEGQGEAPAFVMAALKSVLIYGDVALALFLGWMLVANLAGLGFSHEGKSYWMLKAAPLSAKQLLTAKFLVAFLPTFVISSVYILVLQVLKGNTLWSMLVSLASVALILAGLTGIYLAFGVRGAKFDWESPQQMGGTVGCLGSLISFAYLPVCFVLFVGPNLAAGLLGLPALLGQLVGLLLGGAAGVAGVIIPLGMVVGRVPRLGEN